MLCNSKQFVIYTNLFLLLLASTNCRKHVKTKSFEIGEKDLLLQSEVVVKFPVYALELPPLITARKLKNANINPIPISCSSNNVTKSIMELRKKTQCIPRDTIVNINSQENSVVTPNAVLVKRCGGMCNSKKRCIAVQRRDVQFYVTSYHEPSGMLFCNSIKVKEDTKCQCKCPKKITCTPQQVINSNSCRCMCPNIDEMNDCLRKTKLNFKWNSQTCSCECKSENMCTSGTVWLRDKCQCVKQSFLLKNRL